MELQSQMQGNRILAALPPSEAERIEPHLRPVLLHHGCVLFRPGQTVESVYFLTAGLCSSVVTATNTKGVETALIGSEGLVGGSEAISGFPTLSEMNVQAPGKALVLPVDMFIEQFAFSPTLQKAVMQSLHMCLAQAAQSSLCNAMHPIEQKLARWLLMAYDMVKRDQIELTHVFLAQMLGVRRPAVTVAASELKRRGLIDYTRGNVTILDAEGLEATTCECYGALKKHYNLLHSSNVATPA